MSNSQPLTNKVFTFALCTFAPEIADWGFGWDFRVEGLRGRGGDG